MTCEKYTSQHRRLILQYKSNGWWDEISLKNRVNSTRLTLFFCFMFTRRSIKVSYDQRYFFPSVPLHQPSQSPNKMDPTKLFMEGLCLRHPDYIHLNTLSSEVSSPLSFSILKFSYYGKCTNFLSVSRSQWPRASNIFLCYPPTPVQWISRNLTPYFELKYGTLRCLPKIRSLFVLDYACKMLLWQVTVMLHLVCTLRCKRSSV